MENTAATDRTARPFGIRKATSRSSEPVRRFATEAAAIAEAAEIARLQRAAWIVSGPTGTFEVA